MWASVLCISMCGPLFSVLQYVGFFSVCLFSVPQCGGFSFVCLNVRAFVLCASMWGLQFCVPISVGFISVCLDVWSSFLSLNV